MRLTPKFFGLLAGLLLAVFGASTGAGASPISGSTCDSANVFTKIFDQVCWTCFIDGFDIGGLNSNRPEGSSSAIPCMCSDDLGIPELGIKASFWAPSRINEVVVRPWSSPALGCVQLQDSSYGQGYIDTRDAGNTSGFFHYHYFSYPLLTMLELLLLPGCHPDEIIDFDLLYLSELDPLWSNDLLSILLSPEAVLFASPLAMAWCSTDCITTTADKQKEAYYGCAACDGSLYPFTGNVAPVDDPIAASSLITQRTLAQLHRKGLAIKSMGSRAMCGKRVYAPMIPRSQYRFSMLSPVAEAKSGGLSVVGEGEDDSGGDSEDDRAGKSGVELKRFGKCCHPMGMSTLRWATAAGGRLPPGKDKAFVYLIWRYQDCCIT